MNKPEHGNLSAQRIATYLLVVCLVIRSFLALLTVEFPEGGLTLDSKEYIDLSESIRYEGTYYGSEGSSDLRRPPVYPAFLALFQSRVGLVQAGVSLAQLGLGSLTSLVVLWFFKRRGFTSSGIFMGWLIAISPNINLWSLTIMSEVLFALLLILAFTLVILGLDKSSMKMIYFGGVILGLATLTRPIGFVIVILWVLIAVIASIRGWLPSLSISTGIWFLLGSATLILPWMVRNAIIHNTFSVSDIGSHTLESFNFAIVLSEAEGISRNDATYALGELGGTWDQFRWIITQYPLQFVKSQLAGAGRVIWGTEITRWATVLGHQDWSGFGVFRYLRVGDWELAMESVIDTLQTPSEISLLFIYVISLAYNLLIMILSIVSLLAIKRLELVERQLVWLSLMTVLTMVFISGAAGQARFRVPVEPFVALMAGYGWLQIAGGRRRRISRE